jgi:hypothetical protein
MSKKTNREIPKEYEIPLNDAANLLSDAFNDVIANRKSSEDFNGLLTACAELLPESDKKEANAAYFGNIGYTPSLAEIEQIEQQSLEAMETHGEMRRPSFFERRRMQK